MNERRSSTNIERSIGETRVAFTDALRHGDTKAAASVYADGARLLAPGAELIEGREAIHGFWQAGLDAGVAEVELDAIDVQRWDRMAYEIGQYALRLDPAAGRAVVERGRYVLVLEQVADGSWRRAVEMFSPEASSTVPGQVGRAR